MFFSEKLLTFYRQLAGNIVSGQLNPSTTFCMIAATKIRYALLTSFMNVHIACCLYAAYCRWIKVFPNQRTKTKFVIKFVKEIN